MADPYWRADRGQFYVRVKDPTTGRWRDRATGATAIREAREFQRELAARLRSIPKPTSSTTALRLREVVGPWLERRERRGLRDVRNDRARLTKHVLPTLGEHEVTKIRPRDLVTWLEAMRTTGLAPRTIRKTYGVLHKLFADLRVDEVVERSPCVLTKDQLPKNVDKNREWRSGAIFTREEAEVLVSSVAIPDDRRTFNALLLFTGARLGEVAGLRWHDLDERAEPLHRLTINRSFAGALKTEVPRQVPVHPVLAAMLAEWRLAGFEKLMGRKPLRDDLLVPSRRGLMRTGNQVRGKFLDDLKRLGFRPRRVHDLRRTFITLARADGARPDQLEQVTHGVRGNIMNAYTTLPWDTLCETVRCVNLRRVSGDVVRIRLVENARRDAMAATGAEETAASVTDFASAFASALEEKARSVRKSWTKHAISKRNWVEAAGIEREPSPHEIAPGTITQGFSADRPNALTELGAVSQADFASVEARLHALASRARQAFARGQRDEALARFLDLAAVLDWVAMHRTPALVEAGGAQ